MVLMILLVWLDFSEIRFIALTMACICRLLSWTLSPASFALPDAAAASFAEPWIFSEIVSIVEDSSSMVPACSLEPWARDCAPAETCSEPAETCFAEALIWFRSLLKVAIIVSRLDLIGAKSFAKWSEGTTVRSPFAILLRAPDISSMTLLSLPSTVPVASARVLVSSSALTAGTGEVRSPVERRTILPTHFRIGSAIDFATAIERKTPAAMHRAEEPIKPKTENQMDDVISAMGATTPIDQPSVFFTGA